MEWFRKEELIPKAWTEDRITLLPKSGSKRKLDNDQTMSMGSNMGKLFAILGLHDWG